MATQNVKMTYKTSKPLDETDEAKTSAKLVNEFIKKSHTVLDQHKINRTRLAKGKLKANIILTRDSAHLLPKFYNINDKYHVKFVSLTDMPVERGISKLTGMYTAILPPPSNNLKKDCILRVKRVLPLLTHYDCFYIHIKGPDEPGHDGNINLKTRLISIIDKHFIGRLLDKIKRENYIICVTSDHSTPCKIRAHSDDPVPLLIFGDRIEGDRISKFSERECRNGSLGTLPRGIMLLPKLINWVKA